VTGAPLPAGFRIELDAATRQLGDGSLFGGSPARAMRLTAAGEAALRELQAGPVSSAASGVLARRLTDAGLAHPVPPPAAASLRAAGQVTVIIPVRDRAAMLERCLTALGGDHPVIVVDDGSAGEAEIAAVAKRHHAELRRRLLSAGPAAARNIGLTGVETELVAFLDSDCEPPPGWIAALAAHLADPLAGAVAPRVVAAPAASTAGRYEQARGSLDLGDRAARVLPGSRVSYVPTAALLVRSAALAAAGWFDEGLRYGEDVDLIWRLHEAGWRIRYEPAVQVLHHGPDRWPALLARRFRYGTSAAPLASRHPGNLAPLVLQPWPAITAAALLAGRPAVAAMSMTSGWLELTGTVRRAGLPADGAAAASVTAVRQTWLGAGRYATQFAGPALALAVAAPGRLRRRLGAASLLLGPPLTAYAQRKPRLDPVRFTLAHIADDVCYGAGVWTGCLAGRIAAPLRPVISRRPLRVTTSEGKVL
jgi:mycofactocin system glycosyltransferase